MASACSCAIAPTPGDLNSIDTVFSGTVTAIGRPAIQNSGAQHSVDFEVDRVWLGTATWRTRVHTSGSGASCGYDFTIGERYLVYARAAEVSLCSPTQLLTDDAVQALEVVTGPAEEVTPITSGPGVAPEDTPKETTESLPPVAMLVAAVLTAVTLAVSLWPRDRVK